MDPTSFNFNTAASLTGTNQAAPPPPPSSFGSSLGKPSFGATLFAKSVLGPTAKKEGDAPAPNNEPSTSGSLAGRLIVPSKAKELAFKAKGDSQGAQNAQREGFFKIKKSAFGQLERRKKEDSSENNPYTRTMKNHLKPGRPPMQAPLFSAIGKKDSSEPKSAFGVKTIAEGVDQTDHAPIKELPPSMFGVPLEETSTSSSMKGFGSMPNLQDKPVPFGKRLGDTNFKALKPKTRESPAPEGRPIEKSSGPEEGRLVQKLANLRRQVCAGDYEKYVILDERDKILCQLREIDSKLVLRLERCEEMCTEKERYQRIVQKGVSPFECDIATGDAAHEMMVKQYARSAADQERPLPHELRSEKIMNHAMCYLLHNILDEFPESADQRAAWYNFLWSRTRALRKEVTQLSMSDLLALNLVERCTRLHILFGYVLCDLETEHFDTAMNNETLGKCLQTLRHLYEDFAKRGIPCENEPEFRAYDVMLHMNDTNVLSQVLSYRSDVRQSQPICLALKLAGAFRDKNYCRFFRLLKNEATFLQCCVSHKLFGATRSNAISIMVNSYGRNAFPLEKLRNILAFDLIEEVTETLNIYGLRTESESDHVMLTKDGLTLNESVPMKPYQWIDQKKTGKLSQVVYGPNLFQFFASRCDVSNSFNHRNEYTNDKVLEAVLDGSNIPVSSDPSAFSFAQSAGSLSMQATMEQKRKMEVERIKKQEEEKREHLVQKLMHKVIDEVVFGLIEEETRRERVLRKQLKAVEEAKRRREEQERIRMEMELRRQEKEKEVARKIADKIQKQAADEELRLIVKTQIQVERTKREQQLAQRVAEHFWAGIFLKSVDKCVLNICVEMVNEKEAIMDGLEEFRNRMERLWILQFWNRWRAWVRMKKETRIRKMEMVRKCVPRWESEEVINNLSRKYASPNDMQISSLKFTQNLSAANSIQLKVFMKNRRHRITLTSFRRWREYAKKRKMLRNLAEEQQRRENAFFKRFESGERITETQFKFDKPDDWMKAKRRKSDNGLARKPLRDSKTITLFVPNTSLFVARRQLEDWEPEMKMPSELNKKIKRARESFEKTCQEHLTKKKRDEEFISKEAKSEAKNMKKVSEKADSLLDETLQYTADLDRMIAEIKARRVDDL